LPEQFSGILGNSCAKTIARATFGAVALEADVGKYVLALGEVRFTAFVPPRGDFAAAMFEKSVVFGETAQLLAREAAPSHPP
jgi:hypothetical protein